MKPVIVVPSVVKVVTGELVNAAVVVLVVVAVDVDNEDVVVLVEVVDANV